MSLFYNQAAMETRRLLDAARGSPQDAGRLELIVLRLPGEGRRTPPEAALSVEGGLAGDRWSLKADADPAQQVSVINARFLAAIAGERSLQAAETSLGRGARQVRCA